MSAIRDPDNEDTQKFAKEPWDVLRAAGFTEEADQVEKEKLADRGDHLRKQRGGE